MAETPNLTVRIRFIVRGGHTHVFVFAGKDFDHLAKCGDLIFRNEEWIVAQSLFSSRPGCTVEVIDNDMEFTKP